MADNCHMLEGWPFHAAFPDGCWDSDSITHETDTLIRALQLSLSADTDVFPAFAAAGCSPFLLEPEPAASSSASDAESRSRHHPPPPQWPPATGKISKRKSRVSRRPATTFIAADPANFRRMVQQVTGQRPGPAAGAAALRPEPRRSGLLVDCLPTLDTSALLLGSGGGGAASAGGSSGSPSLGSHAEVTFRAAGFDAELPLPYFPTLESWGAM